MTQKPTWVTKAHRSSLSLSNFSYIDAPKIREGRHAAVLREVYRLSRYTKILIIVTSAKVVSSGEDAGESHQSSDE